MNKILVMLPLLCLSFNLYAIPPGQWECSAFDNYKHNYKAYGKTLQQAMNNAYMKCSGGAKRRTGCRTAQSFCQQGPLSLIDDRCIVSDDAGRAWNTTGLNACKTALSLCTQWQFNSAPTTGSNCIVRFR
jgi:hypothetical protein